MLYVFLIIGACSITPIVAQTNESKSAQSKEQLVEPKTGSRKAVIKSRPQPEYTEQASLNQVEGTVMLKLVLASSGEITNITVIHGLPDGLTEEAIKAARKIKFEPAFKDGRFVSQWVVIKYHFKL